jgi:hypothetical protein
VVSSGERGYTKIIDFSDKRLPIPLFESGFKYPQGVEYMFIATNYLIMIKIIEFPCITKYQHIIGNMYGVEVIKDDRQLARLLDIDRKKKNNTRNRRYRSFY